MHRTFARSLALGALAVVAHVAAAQSPGILAAAARSPGSAPVALNVLWPVHSLTGADRERLDATIRRADTLVLTRNLMEASRLYWSVVAEQHAAEDYPVTALRRLADMYAGVGDDNAAANALMDLASSASEFGDPATRLEALFDAALSYRTAGRPDRVVECVQALRPLLKSVAIPERIRADIQSRIVLMNRVDTNR